MDNVQVVLGFLMLVVTIAFWWYDHTKRRK